MNSLLAAISKSLNADILVYTGDIDSPSDQVFIEKVRNRNRRKNVLLIVTTGGGQADAAFRMMRYLHHAYDKGLIHFLVIDRCKSAGTMMAIGADVLIMVDDAHLGPLDVQVLKPDELGEYTSGLTAYQALVALRNETFQAFEADFLRLRRYSGFQITTRTAADIAAKLATGGTQKLYEQIDPMRLAEHQRAMTIAQEYGVRLDRGNLKDEALEQLITDYPSHGFAIDLKEATTLFKKVRLPTKQEHELCVLLAGSQLCSELHASHIATIAFLPDDLENAKVDKRKDDDNASKKRKTRPKAAGKGRGRVSADGASDPQPRGAAQGRHTPPRLVNGRLN